MPFGKQESQLLAHNSLITGTESTIFCGSFHVVVGSQERNVQLRSVNNGEVRISRQVVFANYSCGHNVFFNRNIHSRAPSTCPLEDGGQLIFEDYRVN